MGEVLLLKLAQIKIHLNLALSPAEGIWNADTGNGNQPDTELIERNVERLLFVEPFTTDAVLQDWNARRVVLEDQRWSRPRGELPQDRLNDGCYLRYRLRDGDPWLKKDFNYRNAVIGSGFDVLDVIYSGS